MKKVFCLMLVALLIFSVAPVSFASTKDSNDSEVVVQFRPITDEKELFERALLRISDKGAPVVNPRAWAKDNKGNNLEVNLYTTTQLLKIVKDKDNNTKNYFATTTFAIPKADQESKVQSIRPKFKSSFLQQFFKPTMKKSSFFLSDSSSKSLYEPTLGVKAYSTVYYQLSYHSGTPYYGMTSVTGGWTVSSGYAATNKKVSLGQNGYYYGGFTNTQVKDYSLTAFTYSYNVSSFGWQPIGSGSVGTTSNTRVTRGTTYSYDLKLENNVLNSSQM